MGLLDNLRNLIRGSKPAQLESTNEFRRDDIDKTWPFITINAIKSLLENDIVFDRFMHFDQNQDYFKNLDPEFIASSVKAYVDFMADKGARFDRTTQKKIDKIVKVLPKEQRQTRPQFKQYGNLNKTQVYNAAMRIVTSEQELFQFLDVKTGNGFYQGIPKEVITDFISTELSEFTRKIVANEQMDRSINFIRHKQSLIADHTYKTDPRIGLNPEFENSIYQGIKSREPAAFALELYNELNKRVKYNPAFFALDQDLNDQFARDIYYKGFNQTTNQDNSVVCKQWSELYAHLLQKCGYEAYVTGKGKHKKVIAFFGTTMIEADATNQTTSPDDPSRLTDLTRSKLGVRPAGFKAYDLYGEKPVAKNLDTISLNYDTDDLARNDGASQQVIELMNHIHDDRNLSSLVMGLNNPNDIRGSVMKKLGFISDMLKGSKLDNMDSVGYLNHLFHCVLTPDELQVARSTNAFYENLYTNDCNMVPIISINNAEPPNAARPGDFLYFVFNQKTHAIEPIDRAVLIDKVVKGTLIQGRGKNDRAFIPGLPEITDRRFLEEQRRIAHKQRVAEEMYYATEGTAKSYYGTEMPRREDDNEVR